MKSEAYVLYSRVVCVVYCLLYVYITTQFVIFSLLVSINWGARTNSQKEARIRVKSHRICPGRRKVNA